MTSYIPCAAHFHFHLPFSIFHLPSSIYPYLIIITRVSHLPSLPSSSSTLFQYINASQFSAAVSFCTFTIYRLHTVLVHSTLCAYQQVTFTSLFTRLCRRVVTVCCWRLCRRWRWRPRACSQPSRSCCCCCRCRAWHTTLRCSRCRGRRGRVTGVTRCSRRVQCCGGSRCRCIFHGTPEGTKR